MLSPLYSPAGTQTESRYRGVKSPWSRAQTLLLVAASLAHLLGIMVQNSAPVILLLGQFSAIRII